MGKGGSVIVRECGARLERKLKGRRGHDSLELDEDKVGDNVVVGGSQSREKDGIDERNEGGGWGEREGRGKSSERRSGSLKTCSPALVSRVAHMTLVRRELVSAKVLVAFARDK